MNSTEEQQMLASLAEISSGIKLLNERVGALIEQQDKADTKAFQQLSNIAHKR